MASVNSYLKGAPAKSAVLLAIDASIENHAQLREAIERTGHCIDGEIRFECPCRDELVFEKLEDLPLYDLKMPCDEDHWAITWDHRYLIAEA
jgi:hypothetical protein